MVLIRPWRWHHSAAMTVTAIAIIASSIALAYLSGVMIWLDTLPWVTWVMLALFLFGVGLMAGAIATHYGAYRGLVRHIYTAAQRPQSSDMDTMLARIYLMVLDLQQQRSAGQWRELIGAIAALTDSPLTQGQCRYCGSIMRSTTDPFSPANHEAHCPVPYARTLVIRELSKLK